MERRMQMSSFTDDLMKQILGYAELTQRNLSKIENSIPHNSKQVYEETQNEVTKMIYRTKGEVSHSARYDYLIWTLGGPE